MEDLLGLACFGIVTFINIMIVVWVYRDAEERGQSGCLVAALVFFGGIIGLIIWLVLRDNLKPSSSYTYQTQMGETRPCPYCAESIQKEAVICRFCGNTVKPEHDFSPEPMPEKQVCPNCQTVCGAYDDFCPQCMTALGSANK